MWKLRLYFIYIMKNIPFTKDSRYTDNLSKCISIEDKLEKLVDKETFDLITKALEYQNEMFSVEMEEAFIEVFSLTPLVVLPFLFSRDSKRGVLYIFGIHFLFIFLIIFLLIITVKNSNYHMR